MILREDGVTEVSLYHAVASLDRATNDMLLPGYLDEEHCTGVTLTDGHQCKRIIPLPNVQVKNELKGVLVELHMFYLQYPSKCMQCDCEVEECACADYSQLWEQNVRSMGTSFRGRLTRAQMSTLLPGWRMWAARRGLVGKQLQMCDGSVSLRNPVVQMFDRAQLGFVQLAGSNQEGHTRAKNSIVVISHHTDGEWDVGRVCCFFAATPPGHEHRPDNAEHQAQIADVRWYGRAPASPSLTREKLDKVLGCPVVMRAHRVDELGNYWCAHQLLRCKVGLVPHPSVPGQMVALSRSADFLSKF